MSGDAELDGAVAALSGALGVAVERCEPLTGGITNRNFRVVAGGRELVLRLPGDDTRLLGIDRLAERDASMAAAERGIGPEVVAFLEPGGLLVTRFVPGEPLTEERVRAPDVLSAVAAALRAFHGGPALPATFSPFAIGPAYRRIVEERGASVPAIAAEADAVAAGIRALVRGPEHDPVPCHNDLLSSNLLWHDGEVTLLDWEYAGMGDRYFDLANLSVNNGLSPEDDTRLLRAYFGADGATARRCARLALMRIMSDYREAMWGVLQDAISSLEFDFADYARRHFARLLAAARSDDFARWCVDAADAPSR